MKKSIRIKLASTVGCISGLVCAFSTGMYLATGSFFSIPAIFMLSTTVLFLLSVILYIFWSRD